DPANIEDFSLSAIQNIPGLGIDLLPLRSPPDDPLTPFANGQLPRLIRSLRAQYDLVVIDGPLLRDPRLLGDELVSEMIAAVVTQVDLRRHARYRFGDTGESLMKFRQYYVEGPGWTPKKLGFVSGADAARHTANNPADTGTIVPEPLDGRRD